MNKLSRIISTTLFTLLAATFLIACASSPAAPAADAGGDSYAEPEMEEQASASDSGGDGEMSADAGDTFQLTNSEEGGEPVLATGLAERKIIREATISIEATDITTALNQATILSARIGGYTLRSNMWQEGDERNYASFSFAVPVQRFEDAMEQSRRLGKVTGENITSQDVTAQFIDTEARIKNLEATAERVRTILEGATELKYVLQINQELSRVEGNLESLKGQRNALAQKTSFSTIHLDLVPPPIVQSTVDVIEEATVWSPAATFNEALAVLFDAMQSIASLAIWVLVVGLPICVILGLVWLLVRGLGRRVRRAVPNVA